jgi:hypothetical protein
MEIGQWPSQILILDEILLLLLQISKVWLEKFKNKQTVLYLVDLELPRGKFGKSGIKKQNSTQTDALASRIFCSRIFRYELFAANYHDA